MGWSHERNCLLFEGQASYFWPPPHSRFFAASRIWLSIPIPSVCSPPHNYQTTYLLGVKNIRLNSQTRPPISWCRVRGPPCFCNFRRPIPVSFALLWYLGNRVTCSGYMEMRSAGISSKVIAATPRQLESLIRLAESHAKMRLSTEVCFFLD